MKDYQRLTQQDRMRIREYDSIVLRHLRENPAGNTVSLSGSNKRQIATLYVNGHPIATKVRPSDVRRLHSLGMIKLDLSKSNTTDARYQWQTFRALAI